MGLRKARDSSIAIWTAATDGGARLQPESVDCLSLMVLLRNMKLCV